MNVQKWISKQSNTCCLEWPTFFARYVNRVRQQLIWCWKLKQLGRNNYHMSGECHGKPQRPWQRFLGSTTFQSHALGTYSAGTQCFAKLNIIIQIHLSGPTGVLLITTNGSLPNYFNVISKITKKKKRKAFSCWASKLSCASDEQSWVSEAVSRMNTPAHPAFPMALPQSTKNTSYKIPPYVTITLHWALC